MHEQPSPGWSASSFFFPDPALPWIPLLSSWPKWSTWECKSGENKGTWSSVPPPALQRHTLRGRWSQTPSPGGQNARFKNKKGTSEAGKASAHSLKTLSVEWKGSTIWKTCSLSTPVYAGGDARCDNSRGTCIFPSSPLRPDENTHLWTVGWDQEVWQISWTPSFSSCDMRTQCEGRELSKRSYPILVVLFALPQTLHKTVPTSDTDGKSMALSMLLANWL